MLSTKCHCAKLLTARSMRHRGTGPSLQGGHNLLSSASQTHFSRLVVKCFLHEALKIKRHVMIQHCIFMDQKVSLNDDQRLVIQGKLFRLVLVKRSGTLKLCFESQKMFWSDKNSWPHFTHVCSPIFRWRWFYAPIFYWLWKSIFLKKNIGRSWSLSEWGPNNRRWHVRASSVKLQMCSAVCWQSKCRSFFAALLKISS